MKINIVKEVNPFLETLGLVYLARNADEWKDALVQELNCFGIDGADFCRHKLGYLEQYVASFSSRYIPTPGEAFFFQDDVQFPLLMLAVLSACPELHKTDEVFSDGEILSKISPVLLNEFTHTVSDLSSLESCVQFVQQLDADMNYKWKLLMFLNSPANYLSQFMDIYEKNLPAYEYAFTQNRAVLEPLIAACPDYLHPSFAETVASLGGDADFYVSLAFPLLEVYIASLGVCGLLVDQLYSYGEEREQAKNELMLLLKALGDKSKFEILYALKEAPKYNLEIAELLHLTPATMSHHMNILLAQGFVSVEKRDGKVYYRLAPAQIERVQALLKEVLL